MPLPNFHSARIKSPDAFVRIVTLQTLPNGIAILGGPLKSDPSGSGKPQAYRFPKAKFTVAQAKAWLKEHDITYVLFEPAAPSARAASQILISAAGPMAPEGDAFTRSGVAVRKFRKEIAKKGNWIKHATGQVFELTEEKLDNFVAMFSRMKENGVAVKLMSEHSEEPGDTRGDIEEISINGDGGLEMVVEVQGQRAIEEALRNDVSIYVPSECGDGKGNIYHEAITHVALTPGPVLTGLGDWKAIAASMASDVGGGKMDWSKVKEALKIEGEMTDETAIEMILGAVKKNGEAVEASQAEAIEKQKKALKDKDAELATIKASMKGKEPDPVLVDLASDNRRMKLNALVAGARITPAVCEKLSAVFSEKKALALSLKRGGDNFDAVVAALMENDPVKLKEQSGPQAIKLSRQEEDKTKGVLEKDAERRAEEAKS